MLMRAAHIPTSRRAACWEDTTDLEVVKVFGLTSGQSLRAHKWSKSSGSQVVKVFGLTGGQSLTSGQSLCRFTARHLVDELARAGEVT